MALYDDIGRGYRSYRRPDARIAAQISRALGDARTVVNVGAGTGSYEPVDREVVAVEPSAEMIAQRPRDACRVVQASAESLPFADDQFDAALAILTLHHWRDVTKGLQEMRRVARDRIVILNWDPNHPSFWISDYFPELLETDLLLFESVRAQIASFGEATIEVVPVPHDCTDGFLGAYWRRPEAYLDPGARLAISTFSKIGDHTAGLTRLSEDIASGRWAENNRALLELDELDLGYRLVCL